MGQCVSRGSDADRLGSRGLQQHYSAVDADQRRVGRGVSCGDVLLRPLSSAYRACPIVKSPSRLVPVVAAPPVAPSEKRVQASPGAPTALWTPSTLNSTLRVSAAFPDCNRSRHPELYKTNQRGALYHVLPLGHRDKDSSLQAQGL